MALEGRRREAPLQRTVGSSQKVQEGWRNCVIRISPRSKEQHLSSLGTIVTNGTKSLGHSKGVPGITDCPG